MSNKSNFLNSIKVILERSQVEDGEKYKLISFLTKENFGLMDSSDLNRIAELIESEKSAIEQEISESGDPDMINEMSEVIEAIENIEYESFIKNFKDAMSVAASQKVEEVRPSGGAWLLDKFAGLADSDEE